MKTKCSTTSLIGNFGCGFAISIVEDFCNFLSNVFAFPVGLGYFSYLFGVVFRLLLKRSVQ